MGSSRRGAEGAERGFGLLFGKISHGGHGDTEVIDDWCKKYHTEAQRAQRLALAREGGFWGSSLMLDFIALGSGHH